MKTEFDADTAGFARALAAPPRFFRAAFRSALLRAGSTVRGRLQRQGAVAGLGKIARLWRRQVQGVGRDQELTVEPFARVKRRGGAVELLTGFAEGGTIRARSGKWLVLKTERGRAELGPRRQTPASFPPGTFYTRLVRGRLFWIRVGRPPGEALFIGVKQVRVPKLLDPDASLRGIVEQIPQRVMADFDRRWNREFDRLVRGRR